jgi:tetratricopeptide (TPR) repeat protein
MTQKPSDALSEGSGRSRYAGTRPFRDLPEDYVRFFGRRAETEELYLRILSVPLLVQFGRSGLGKTSLLQAGLFPLLRNDSSQAQLFPMLDIKPFFPVMVRLNEPKQSLTFAVADAIRQTGKAWGLELTEGRTDGLWELLLTTSVWRDDVPLTPILVFDQFEEVFTLRDSHFRGDLASELGAVATGIAPERLRTAESGVPEQFSARPNVKIVISLREDYLGALQEFTTAIPGLFHERLRLEPLTENGARAAITEPAQLKAAAGEEPYWAPPFGFEPAVLDRMIKFLQGTSGEIEPFQLQLLCRHAEKIAFSKSGKSGSAVMLEPSDFSGTRDFPSVLKNFYRDTLDKLPQFQKKRAERLCEEGLLNASGHRRMREQDEIQKEFGIDKETLNILSQERLVHCEPRHESFYYEISHDRLAESIFQSKPFRLSQELRRALWTAGIAVAVILMVGAYSLYKVNAERQHAEALNRFLLGESFLGEVRDTGRSDMLEQVRDETKAYTGDQRSGKTYWDRVRAWFSRRENSDVARLRGLALRNEGDLKLMQGFIGEAVKRFEEALRLFESGRDDLDSRREAARTRDRLGDALGDEGYITQALSRYDAAADDLRQVIAGARARDANLDKADRKMYKELAPDCADLASILVSASELRQRMGNITQARKDLDEALKIGSTLLFGHQSFNEGCRPISGKAEPYPSAKTLEVFGQAVLARAVLLNFKEDYEGAAALANRAKWLKPHSASGRKKALVALAWRGNGRRFDEPQRALEDYQKVLAEFEELRRWDPNNRLWQRERAATQLLVSEGIVACHENKTYACKPLMPLEEAEALDLDAVATLRALASIDETNLSLTRDLAWAYESYAQLLAVQGKHLERLARLEESEQLYRKSKVDAANAENEVALGRLLVNKADALVVLGRRRNALESLQQSVDTFKRLIEAHPDNYIYLDDQKEAYLRLAKLSRDAGDTTAADAAKREAKQLTEKYATFSRSDPQESQKLDSARAKHVTEGATLYNRGEYAAALGAFNAAESSIRNYIHLQPTYFRGYDKLRNVYAWIEVTQDKLGNAEQRAAALSAAMYAAQFAALLAPEKQMTEMNLRLLQCRHNFAKTLYDNDALNDALAMVQEEVVVAEELVRESSQNADYLWSLGNAKFGQGIVRRQLAIAGWEEAIRSGLIHIQKAVEIDRKNFVNWKELGMQRKYLFEELAKDGLNEKAAAEYRLALEAYQKAASLKPTDGDVQAAIRELSERKFPSRVRRPDVANATGS